MWKYAVFLLLVATVVARPTEERSEEGSVEQEENSEERYNREKANEQFVEIDDDGVHQVRDIPIPIHLLIHFT